MGEFIGSNWFQKNNEFDLVRLSQMFAEYDENAWEELGGGLIQYSTEDRLFQLLIEHRTNLGFLLNYLEKIPRLKTLQSLYSLQDQTLLADFDELDEIHYPVGCFLTPQLAFAGIEDFVKNPLKPSERVAWIDGNEINWPEL
jgi:hypothetical protein